MFVGKSAQTMTNSGLFELRHDLDVTLYTSVCVLQFVAILYSLCLLCRWISAATVACNFTPDNGMIAARLSLYKSGSNPTLLTAKPSAVTKLLMHVNVTYVVIEVTWLCYGSITSAVICNSLPLHLNSPSISRRQFSGGLNTPVQAGLLVERTNYLKLSLNWNELYWNDGWQQVCHTSRHVTCISVDSIGDIHYNSWSWSQFLFVSEVCRWSTIVLLCHIAAGHAVKRCNERDWLTY